MSPEFLRKWEHILADVEKSRIPVEFLKKIVLRLDGRKQKTINIKKMLDQGLISDEIEDVLGRILTEFDHIIKSVEFILNVESIAETVQPETDKFLKNL